MVGQLVCRGKLYSAFPLSQSLASIHYPLSVSSFLEPSRGIRVRIFKRSSINSIILFYLVIWEINQQNNSMGAKIFPSLLTVSRLFYGIRVVHLADWYPQYPCPVGLLATPDNWTSPPSQRDNALGAVVIMSVCSRQLARKNKEGRGKPNMPG